MLLNIPASMKKEGTLLFITVINANAAVTLLEQRPEKNLQALSGIRTHDLCDAGAVLSQLSYQALGFSVRRALHRHHRGRWFESRSELEFFFSDLCSSVTATFALMTVIAQLLLMDN